MTKIKKKSSPLLSIIMPFYNQQEMVAEMIDSIIANDFQDWELLAIDDGSSQEAIDHLSKYKLNPRIQIIHRAKEPKGAQTCRNIGLEMARGKYIVFFDSDDYISPSCLKSRVQTISKKPHADFVVFPSGQYKEGVFSTLGTDIYGYDVHKDDLAAFIRRTLPFIVWNNIYKTSSLKMHNLTWDTNLLSYQDSDYNIQALLHGLTYEYAITVPDYGYRIFNNSGSISKKITSPAHRRSHLYFLDKQYRSVQQVFNHQYDYSLYICALYIYSITMVDGIEFSYASKIADIVSKYDKFRGWQLRLKVKVSCFLGKFLPAKLARQLPMFPYLIHRLLAKHYLHYKTSKLQNMKKT